MQIYWSLKRVPELSGLSPVERQHVHRACYSQHAVGQSWWSLGLLLCGLCTAIGIMGGSLVHSVLGVPFSIWQTGLGGAIGGGIGGGIFGQIVISHLRTFYADYIKNKSGRETAEDHF